MPTMASSDTTSSTVAAADRRLRATYRVRSAARDIEARAQAIALEQSIEAPLEAVMDRRILDEVVGRVHAITPIDDGVFDVSIDLATETVADDASQLMNVLFGNASLLDDVALVGVDLPSGIARTFGGPRFGIDGLRDLTGVRGRPLTCAALKPQGSTTEALASLARTFARAGIDVIKDDHALAHQAAAPFDERVPAVQRAVQATNAEFGTRCLYAPNVIGTYDAVRRQVDLARSLGVRIVLHAPMLNGASSLSALARNGEVAIVAHPALAGATRIAPPLLLGTLFRLFGADASIFPNAGGRFTFTQDACMGIADAARRPWLDLAPMLPVPAGGMSVERVPEMRERFGIDAMMLIGGSLLRARERLDERCRAFVAAVQSAGDFR